MQQDTIEVPSGSSSGPFTAKLKLEKPPTFDGNPSKLSDWIFLVIYYLDIMGVNNKNLQAKYEVAILEAKALTRWCSISGEHALDSLSWRDLCTYLEDKF